MMYYGMRERYGGATWLSSGTARLASALRDWTVLRLSELVAPVLGRRTATGRGSGPNVDVVKLRRPRSDEEVGMWRGAAQRSSGAARLTSALCSSPVLSTRQQGGQA